MISAGQIKAARAMLDWTQDALAQESGLSLATIRNLEKGHLSPRSSAEVSRVFERKGFEFSGQNGLSRRLDEHKIYHGANSCHELCEDILNTAQETKCDIAAIFQTQEVLAQALGVTDFDNLGPLDQLSKVAAVKCILSDARNSSHLISTFQFRAIPNHPLAPMSSFIIYGDKTALVVRDGKNFTYFVMKSAAVAQDGIKKFEEEWKFALPFSTQTAHESRRA